MRTWNHSTWRLGLLVHSQKQKQKQKRGKWKSCQAVIGMLHNGGSDAVRQASGLDLASGPRRTHGMPIHSVKLIYSDLLITIMKHQRHRLILNTLFIQAQPSRSNEGRLSAFLNRSMGVTLARITLLLCQASIGLVRDYSSLGSGLKNR